jgi:hypothetical protein
MNIVQWWAQSLRAVIQSEKALEFLRNSTRASRPVNMSNMTWLRIGLETLRKRF